MKNQLRDEDLMEQSDSTKSVIPTVDRYGGVSQRDQTILNLRKSGHSYEEICGMTMFPTVDMYGNEKKDLMNNPNYRRSISYIKQVIRENE